MKSPTLLHLDIDAFFAAVEVVQNPALKGKPVIVGGLAHERGVVCTASYEARARGVHSGMALRTAAKKCPQGIFLRGRYRLYSEISRRFFACLRRFSPRVEEVSVDEAYVDLSGSRYLASSVYALAQRIKREAERATGLAISAGLAVSRLGAKLATEAAKPGGFCFLYHEADFIAGLEAERIPGIGPQTAFLFRGLGIRRVWQLEKNYFSFWKRVCGLHDNPRLPAVRSWPSSAESRSFGKSLSRETTFPQDISDRSLLFSHLAYLVDRLAVHLQEEGLHAGRVEVKVRLASFQTFSRRRRLPFPSFSYFQLWRTASRLLAELLGEDSPTLRLVGVAVEELTAQRGLLPFLCLRGERMSAGVREVKARFGFSSICTGRELFLQELYPVEQEGVVLKTASLTK